MHTFASRTKINPMRKIFKSAHFHLKPYLLLSMKLLSKILIAAQEITTTMGNLQWSGHQRRHRGRKFQSAANWAKSNQYRIDEPRRALPRLPHARWWWCPCETNALLPHVLQDLANSRWNGSHPKSSVAWTMNRWAVRISARSHRSNIHLCLTYLIAPIVKPFECCLTLLTWDT